MRQPTKEASLKDSAKPQRPRRHQLLTKMVHVVFPHVISMSVYNMLAPIPGRQGGIMVQAGNKKLTQKNDGIKNIRRSQRATKVLVNNSPALWVEGAKHVCSCRIQLPFFIWLLATALTTAA